MAKRVFESSIQDLVYSVDVGSGYKLLRILLYVLLVSLVPALFYTASQFRGFHEELPMDYAQLGRNISQEKNFVTKCVRPFSMWYVTGGREGVDPVIERHPDLLHAPMYPAVLGGVFAVADLLGADIYAQPEEGERPSRQYPLERVLVMPVNHFCTVLAGLFFWLLARQMFSHRVALLSTTLYFVSNGIWLNSLAAEGGAMALFFVMGALFFMVRSHLLWMQNRFWGISFLMSAVFAAGAFLTRYITASIVPMMLLFWLWAGWGRKRAWLPALLFPLLFGAFIAPWLARNWMLTRSLAGILGYAPYTALIDSNLFPGDSLMRSLRPSVSLSAAVAALKEKWVTCSLDFVENRVYTVGGGLLTAFFFVSFLHRYERRDVGVFRACLLGAMLVFAAVAALFGPVSQDLFVIFAPIVILFGVAYFFVQIDRMEIPYQVLNTGLILLVTITNALPTVLTFLPPRAEAQYPPYMPPFVQFVTRSLNETEVLCSDMPWATAWFGNRISVQLPQNVNDFYDINDYRRNVKGIYLTEITKDKPFVSELMGNEKDWWPISMGRVPQGFPLDTPLEVVRGAQVFITDAYHLPQGAKKSSEK